MSRLLRRVERVASRAGGHPCSGGPCSGVRRPGDGTVMGWQRRPRRHHFPRPCATVLVSICSMGFSARLSGIRQRGIHGRRCAPLHPRRTPE
ncbi:hypothetical protein GZL_08015 [Streptomyces sp. 769]|nr:hypothetical protein GZL_08015 [Streptomyces sp. 769]